uniref:Uncharacterized protein n=1 Tax=viral metagenome TaxID=1070528 RepID=A0A6C0J4Z0_9ZZZZ
MRKECVAFSKSIINNVSLYSGKIYVPTFKQLHEICDILNNMNIDYTNDNMIDILYYNTPKELISIFNNMEVKGMTL